MKDLPTREQVKLEDTWDLTRIFATEDAWEATLRKVLERLPELRQYEGKLDRIDTIKDCLEMVSALSRNLERVAVYASLFSAGDLSNSKADDLRNQVATAFSKLATQAAFINPELSAKDEAFLKKCAEASELADYDLRFKALLREKPHILSSAEERLLAKGAPLWRDNSEIYDKLESVDINFPPALDKDGNPHRVSHATYVSLMESSDRVLRKNTHVSMFGSFKALAHTCAATLNAQVKQHRFFSDIRDYRNTLHAALNSKAIDEAVYQNLIGTTETNLHLLHKYMGIRRRLLEVDGLEMWDLHVPLIRTSDLRFSYEEAVDLILKSVEPLGSDYYHTLKAGLTEQRWVDKYENKGKRSGAFSSGCYSAQPYIMMNFNGTLDNVLTLTHEAGHAMHRYLTTTYQPYSKSHYTIFIAEIASTVNERLLTHYLLQNWENEKYRAVLNQEVDAIRGTFFRQTKFADFERRIHEHVEKGRPLSSAWLCQLYDDLNGRYYGPEMKTNEFTPYEWSRIPHFYENYYVFQYATGIACAYHFSEQILKGNVGPYLTLLKSGGNDFPLNQLEKAGLDMRDAVVYEPLFSRFSDLLDAFD